MVIVTLTLPEHEHEHLCWSHTSRASRGSGPRFRKGSRSKGLGLRSRSGPGPRSCGLKLGPRSGGGRSKVETQNPAPGRGSRDGLRRNGRHYLVMLMGGCLVVKESYSPRFMAIRLLQRHKATQPLQNMRSYIYHPSNHFSQVCLCVCLSYNFWTALARKCIFSIQIHLDDTQVKFEYQGHTVKGKVK